MKKIRLIPLMLLLALLAACSTTPNSAPISERKIGGRDAATKEERGFYTVKKGDTLYRIALDVGQSYSELVTWNNLANPNDIKVGQVLRVVPPNNAHGGAQTGAVVTSSVVEVRTLPSSTGNKTSPHGEKRPYSDATLAELQKPDSVGAAVPAKTASADKTIETSAAGAEESVSWMWPANGKVINTFDEGKKGIDIAGKSGQPVLAAGAGKVMYAGSGIRGYGNLVIVKHTNTLLSAYAHNKSILVKEGQTVSKGQEIAEMGDSDANEVELHFEIRQQGKPVDPLKFLPSR